jgi:hypothetical protein
MIWIWEVLFCNFSGGSLLDEPLFYVVQNHYWKHILPKLWGDVLLSFDWGARCCSKFTRMAHQPTNIILFTLSQTDYNGDYVYSSRGPPPIRHPPGAYHNASHQLNCHDSNFITLIVIVSLLIVLLNNINRWKLISIH